jgi:hypothetical protein
MNRTRNTTAWPLATDDQAQWYTIEKMRTNAGAALLEAEALPAGISHHAVRAVMHAVDAILPRIEIRIDQIRIDPYGEATGIVWTRVDGGDWINEGGYLLSRKSGAPATLAEQPPPDYEPLPEDWDPEENYR